MAYVLRSCRETCFMNSSCLATKSTQNKRPHIHLWGFAVSYILDCFHAVFCFAELKRHYLWFRFIGTLVSEAIRDCPEGSGPSLFQSATSSLVRSKYADWRDIYILVGMTQLNYKFISFHVKKIKCNNHASKVENTNHIAHALLILCRIINLFYNIILIMF